MTSEEQNAILNLADRMGVPPSMDEMEKVPGFHFCPDWDFLAICDGTPEAQCCRCDKELIWPQREATT